MPSLVISNLWFRYCCRYLCSSFLSYNGSFDVLIGSYLTNLCIVVIILMFMVIIIFLYDAAISNNNWHII